MAQDLADFQADAAAAGKIQVKHARFRAQGEKNEQSIPLARMKSAALHGMHIIDTQAAKASLEIAAWPLRGWLPAKTVRHEDKAFVLGKPRNLADGDQGVLKDGRDDG